MKKTARVLYLMNSATNIVIGAFHLKAHYGELVTDDIKELLDHNKVITGIESNIFDLWQGMSLMMGFLLVIIGALHLFILSQTPKSAYPPIEGSIIMIVMLLGVMYTGFHYFSDWQVYGSTFGIIVQSVCLFLCIKGK